MPFGGRQLHSICDTLRASKLFLSNHLLGSLKLKKKKTTTMMLYFCISQEGCSPALRSEIT